MKCCLTPQIKCSACFHLADVEGEGVEGDHQEEHHLFFLCSARCTVSSWITPFIVSEPQCLKRFSLFLIRAYSLVLLDSSAQSRYIPPFILYWLFIKYFTLVNYNLAIISGLLLKG